MRYEAGTLLLLGLLIAQAPPIVPTDVTGTGVGSPGFSTAATGLNLNQISSPSNWTPQWVSPTVRTNAFTLPQGYNLTQPFGVTQPGGFLQ